MSAFSITGISLIARPPVWTSGLVWHENLTDKVSDWQHEIQAIGGFWSASFRLSASVHELNDWLQNGLGRDITAYDASGAIVWNGFIDRMTFNFGAVHAQRGPLSEIANKVDIFYSKVDTSTTPPTVGVRENAGYVEDTTSQGRYGIWTKILSTGGATEDNADQLRDSYLAEHAYPRTTLSHAESQEVNASIECLGYGQLMKAYPYNSTTTGLTEASAKIALLLAADPSSRLSTSTAHISTNALKVKAWENDNDLAWDVAKGIVALGDSSDNRWNMGIYEDRKLHYAVAPTTIAYYQRLYDPGQQVSDYGGAIIAPWNVRPGKWLFFPDFLVGLVPDGQPLLEDPRAAYLESVSYTAPYGFNWTASRLSAIDQRLAQLGLSGIGA